MAQVINTNILSLTAQRNLNESQNSLQTSIERLSSGLRINSAKDDAAGLAIAERFTTQIRGLEQAQRNANDGISFAQTAEGSLGTINDSLQRIRELAVQSVNDTNSAADRESLNNEVQQQIAEVNRVANSTEFNGENILDGSAQNLTFQVGANEGQTISVDGVDARGSQLGAAVGEGSAVVQSELSTAVSNSDTLTINGTDIDISNAKTDGTADTDALVDEINKVAPDTGVSAQKASSTEQTLTFNGDSDDARVVTINNVDVDVATSDTVSDFVDAVNAVSGQTGVSAENTSGSSVKFSNTSGADITIGQDADPDDGGSDNEDVLSGLNPASAGDATSETFQAGVVLSADVGDNPTISYAGTGSLSNVGLNGVSFSDNVLSNVDVLTSDSASDALETVDFALSQVNGLRAELGAVQARFDNTITNLETTSENLSAARSRIQDADFAAETASLTQAQILQQAGISALSQANAAPQNVLSLLN